MLFEQGCHAMLTDRTPRGGFQASSEGGSVVRQWHDGIKSIDYDRGDLVVKSKYPLFPSIVRQ